MSLICFSSMFCAIALSVIHFCLLLSRINNIVLISCFCLDWSFVLLLFFLSLLHCVTVSSIYFLLRWLRIWLNTFSDIIIPEICPTDACSWSLFRFAKYSTSWPLVCLLICLWKLISKCNDKQWVAVYFWSNVAEHLFYLFYIFYFCKIICFQSR